MSECSIQYIPRAAWKAQEPQKAMTAQSPSKITLHHSGVELSDNRESPRKIWQHQRYHIEELQWADLAYHFVVDRNGHIFEGRSLSAVSDSRTDYKPTGHILLCAEGNFNVENPSTPQLDSIVKLAAWSVAEFGIALDQVKGHKDYTRTACPGLNLYRLLKDNSIHSSVRKLVSSKLRLSAMELSQAQEMVHLIEQGNL